IAAVAQQSRGCAAIRPRSAYRSARGRETIHRQLHQYSRDAEPEQALTANFVIFQNYSMPFARLLVINI
ncbi:hypothetical protein ACCS96_49685, partial [Rhizobium ruizarguesonis]